MKMITLAFFLAVAVCAQEPVLPPAEVGKQSETEQETAAKCLQDLKSESPLTRQAAALLLGKYGANRTALQALIRTLQDKDAEVRRSALVSLMENFSLPREARIPVLEMLSDGDVHIRRLVSAAIPYAFSVFMDILPEPGENPQISGRLEIPPATMGKISAAFRDPDSGVRKNMVSNLPVMRGKIRLPSETVAALLEDSVPEIKIIAIQNAMNMLPPEKFPACAEKLLKDTDRLVRLKLAESLKFCQNQPAAEDILSKMLEDDYPPVRAEAVVALLMKRKIRNLEMIEKVVLDPQTETQTGRMIVSFLPSIGEDAAPLLKRIADSPNSPYRASALGGYFNLRRNGLSADDVLPYMGDLEQGVREMAIGRMAALKVFGGDMARKMLESGYADVRAALPDLCGRLDAEARNAILGELLLDESDTVRMNAIRNAAMLRIPGHVEILVNSLLDQNEEIVEASLRELQRLSAQGVPGTREALAKFAEENPDSPFSDYIKSTLERQKKPPVKKNAR